LQPDDYDEPDSSSLEALAIYISIADARKLAMGLERSYLRAEQESQRRTAKAARGFSIAYEPRKRFLTQDEAVRLFAELTPNPSAIVAFILATGARLGEQERAQRQDVDLQSHIVYLRGTKTATAARSVPLVGASIDLMEHALKYADGTDGMLFAPWPNFSGGLGLIHSGRSARSTRCTVRPALRGGIVIHCADRRRFTMSAFRSLRLRKPCRRTHHLRVGASAAAFCFDRLGREAGSPLHASWRAPRPA
jgi:integrase